MLKKKKILLLGGTGAIGRYLSVALSNKGYHVVITSREFKESSKDISFLKGDATKPSFINQIFKNDKFDAVIDFMVHETSEFKKIVRAILNNTDHYIFTSSVRVFSDSGDKKINEDSKRIIDLDLPKKYKLKKEYALIKCEQERILEDSKMKNWTVIRPSITYSTKRLQFLCYEAETILTRSFKSLPVPYCKEIIDKKTTMTWAGDVSSIICRLIFNSAAKQNHFNTVTSEFRSWREVSEIYEEYAQTTFKEVSLSKFEYTALNIWQLKFDRYFNRTFDNSKICKLLKIEKKDFLSLRKGLKFEINNSRQYFQNKHSINHLNGRIDCVTNIIQFGAFETKKNFIGYWLGKAGVGV